jgi:hypothetical protein
MVIPEDEFVGTSELESILRYTVGNYSYSVLPTESDPPEEVIMAVEYQPDTLSSWWVVDHSEGLPGFVCLARADPVAPNYAGMSDELDADDYRDWNRRGIDSASLLSYVAEWDWKSRPPYLVYLVMPRRYEMFLGSVGQELLCNTSGYVIQDDPCDALYERGRGWFGLG